MYRQRGLGVGGWGRGAAPVLPQVVSAEPSGAACLDGGVCVRAFSHPRCWRGRGCVPSTGQCVCGLVRAQGRWRTRGQRPKVWAPCLSLGTDRALLGLSKARWAGGFRQGFRGMGPGVPVGVVEGGGRGVRGWGQAWRFSEKNRAASLPSSPSASTRSAARLTGHGQGVAPERCCASENGVSDKNNPG